MMKLINSLTSMGLALLATGALKATDVVQFEGTTNANAVKIKSASPDLLSLKLDVVGVPKAERTDFLKYEKKTI